ncbi:glycerol acyltransferase [Chlorobaculum limnaeum]|uniref:Glycerol acyltransferase n=1 Tax=Chlorobaculum limnaeum TaxID=274537 RepID=A0A1D8D806_CHLLM|nr:lysophospholipid acyltransferase family protein [Chlorobaculum limnaeum]AOS83789.1 glycerol acyltransferase [Chlorobaculum limnaeum]
MLKVRRSWAYTRWFGWYSRRQFRRHFHSLRVQMPPELPGMETSIPVIFYGNHAYWWDGFWSQLCTELYFRQNLYIIIEYAQLVKHQFFTRLGAFSIDRSNARSAIGTLDYAAECLTTSSARQNALWIFPQGRIEHVDKRPLVFFRGTAGIAQRVFKKRESIYLVSVVSRIEYLEEQKPELFLSFGSPELLKKSDWNGLDALTSFMQTATESHLDKVTQAVVERRLDGFDVVIRGSESINRRVEAFRSLSGKAHRAGE